MISAVIPLFNKRSSIARAIESVFAQTAPPDELIIVNDGSTDGGDVIASELLRRNGLGRMINIANQGVSVARNTGIHAAKSDYVCLLDADDLWLPNHCAVLRAMIETNPRCNLYVSGNVKLDTGIHVQAEQQPFHNMVAAEFFARYARRPGFVHSSAVAVARKAMLDIGGFPKGGVRGEDVYVWLRLAASGRACLHEGVTAVQYRDGLALGRRAAEIPYYIRYYTQPEMIAGELRADLRRILRRGAIASWVASHSVGHDISQSLRNTFGNVDPLMAWFFRFASLPGFSAACARTARRYMAVRTAPRDS